MRILFCGDVVGKSGRRVIAENIPELRNKLKLDCVIVNADNAANGFGITKKIYEELLSCGVDAITGGDHIWDQKETISFIEQCPALLRPHNFPPKTPGTGARVFTTAKGGTVLVIHLNAQIFMKYQLDNPFACVEAELTKHRLRGTVDAIIVDFHGEATSEKMAMGHFLDGKVSLVVGSHTHVPTADTMIFPGGTGYMTDAGMCGDYLSVIGFDKTTPLKGFVQKLKISRLEPANHSATLSGVYIETDDKTGLTNYISPVRIGGALSPILPNE